MCTCVYICICCVDKYIYIYKYVFCISVYVSSCGNARVTNLVVLIAGVTECRNVLCIS